MLVTGLNLTAAEEQFIEKGDSPVFASAQLLTPPRLRSSPGANMYPPAALMKALEGVVYLRFDIDEKGRTSNISVREDGFQVAAFAPAARNWLAGARFEPAKKAGLPVAVTGLQMPIRFQLSGINPGITPAFRDEMNKVVGLLDGKDYAGAHFHAQWMLSEKATLLYEYAVLEATLANTLARTGEFPAALQATRSTTALVSMRTDTYRIGGPIPELSESDFLLPKAMIAQQLRLRFILAAALGLDGEALTAHALLQGLGAVPDDDPTFPEYRKILLRIQNLPRLEGLAKTDESSRWKQNLVFRNLAIRDAKVGAIKHVDVTCDGGFWSSDDPEKFRDAVISMGPDSDACVLNVSAAPGTQFRVVEYR